MNKPSRPAPVRRCPVSYHIRVTQAVDDAISALQGNKVLAKSEIAALLITAGLAAAFRPTTARAVTRNVRALIITAAKVA